ncbi:MAG: TRC40/GET3/ArsA family transport-energizing ATPase [Thermosphaera sp.]
MSLLNLLSPYECCPHLVFVIGKGGVGKTTVSLLFGLILSRIGNTLVLSLDPAKHLVRYVGEEILGREARIREGLVLKQLDVDMEVARELNRHASMIKDMLPSLKVLNIENVVDVVKYMPGVEEEVFLRILQETYEHVKYEFIVIDTPPTGVTLRTLYLPKLYEIWIEKLIEVRGKILSLKYAIAKTLGREPEVKDKALTLLTEMREKYSTLVNVLKDSSKTSYTIVATPEPLPVYELKETVNFLRLKLNTSPKILVLNKILPAEVADRMGLREQQEAIMSELSSYNIPLLSISYLGRPTESLEDIAELENLVKVVS